MFLEGKSNEVIDELVRRMEAASAELAFEQAARYRDQIAALRRVQETQYISGEKGEVDVVAAAVAQGMGCVQVFRRRNCWSASWPSTTCRPAATCLPRSS